MNLPATTAKPAFVPTQPLPAAQGPAPELDDVKWNEHVVDRHMVAVRYTGEVDGKRSTITVRNEAADYPVQITGSFDDAVLAARSYAVHDWMQGKETPDHLGRSSVAVVDAGKGVWQLGVVLSSYGMHDGMDAEISMPIDVVPASKSDASVPYGETSAHPFDAPAKIEVRFDSPKVAALVGVDTIALNPAH